LIDYFHSIAASFWIGGLIFLAFVFINKIRKIDNIEIKSRIVSITIDKFSVVVLPVLGSIVITGPTLLWSLENDLSITFVSLYGKILILKLVLAGIMISIGAYHQLITSKKMRQQIMIVSKVENKVEIRDNDDINNNKDNNKDNNNQQIKKFTTSLRVEAIIGISLLFVVSLMTNMVLPSGELSSSNASINSGTAIGDDTKTDVNEEAAFSTVLYNDNGKIKISLDPLSIGENKVLVNFIDYNNDPIQGIDSAGIKVSQIENNIGPIPIEMDKINEGTFSANIPLSTMGIWNIEIQGQSTKPNFPNIISNFEINVKPQLQNLEFNVTEFKTPDQSLLLYPVYHSKTDSIWVGDTLPGSGRIWEFNTNNNTFTEHTISDTNLITLSAFDTKDDNILWFIDPTSSALGKYNIQTDENEIIQLPVTGIVSGIVTDNDQNIWMTVMQENSLLKYDKDKNDFETFQIPTENARPAGLIHDEINNAIWFTESGVGKIGKLDIQTGNITEFTGQMASINNNNNNNEDKESLMEEPTSLLLDKETSNIYISDHLSNSIFNFNPLLSNFKQYPLPDSNEGLAFGMVFDKYNNLMIAQHIDDTIVVLDPETGKTTSFNIPTTGSFVQYLTTNSNNDIWFAEQRGSALGKVSTKFIPPSPSSLSSSSTPDPQESTAEEVVSNPEQINSGKNANQTIITSINDIIQNTEMKFNDIFGPIIVVSIAVSTILFINSSNRLNNNIKDIEKLEPPSQQQQPQKQKQQAKKKRKNL
jgi:copper transport protein